MKTQTQSIVVWLRRLTDLDKIRRRLEPGSPDLAAIVSELESTRERLPTAILKHYDERRTRGRPAIAPVNNGICGGCHLSLPSGRMAELLRDDGTLHACDNCGVILFLGEEKETPPSPSPKSRRAPAVGKKSNSMSP